MTDFCSLTCNKINNKTLTNRWLAMLFQCCLCYYSSAMFFTFHNASWFLQIRLVELRGVSNRKLATLTSIKPVFHFQSAGTCPFATPSPIGWLVSDCLHTKIKASRSWFAIHMFTFSDSQNQGAERCLQMCAQWDSWMIAFCHLDWDFLLSWAILSPE